MREALDEVKDARATRADREDTVAQRARKNGKHGGKAAGGAAAGTAAGAGASTSASSMGAEERAVVARHSSYWLTSSIQLLECLGQHVRNAGNHRY